MSRFIPSLTQAEEEMRQDLDDLRKRYELYQQTGAGGAALNRDLWRALEACEADCRFIIATEAKYEPVTAEELTHALGNKPSFTLEVWVKAMLDELGPLYRQRKT